MTGWHTCGGAIDEQCIWWADTSVIAAWLASEYDVFGVAGVKAFGMTAAVDQVAFTGWRSRFFPAVTDGYRSDIGSQQNFFMILPE